MKTETETKTFEEQLNQGFDEELESIHKQTAEAHATYLQWLKLLETGKIPTLPEEAQLSFCSALWPASIVIPLDKPMLSQLCYAFSLLGWRIGQWHVGPNSVTVQIEWPDSWRHNITIQAQGQGRNCHIVKIADHENIIIKKDGVYEIVCDEAGLEPF